MTTAERNADFSLVGAPEDDIDYYSFSLTGIMLHELHHALCYICESSYNVKTIPSGDFAIWVRLKAVKNIVAADVPLQPPLTTKSGRYYAVA